MRSSVLVWLAACGLLLTGSGEARADEPARDGGLASIFAQAAQAVPPAAETLAAARGRLAVKAEELGDFLAGGGQETERRWRQWLGLAELERQLQAPQPDPALLQELLERFCENQAGLELPVFVGVRHELKRYAAAVEFAASNDGDELYRRRLAELTECLARLDETPREEDDHRAGCLVAWFEELSDAGASLAAAVRARYCRTNALAHGSGRLINHLLAQEFAERQWIVDFIMGSYTRGFAWSQGKVSFHVVPNPERGLVEVLMHGQSACPENIAERRRIAVYSSADTSIRATKRLFIDDRGLEFAPAVALCATNLQISDVEANRRLVERLAWRRANRLAPQAEQFANQRVQSEASSKLDQRAAEGLAGANDLFRQKVRAPLVRLDALPASWRFWSDNSHLRLSLVQHNRRQLAVASPAVEFPSSCDVALAAHASMINNLSEVGLCGATIRDDTWAEMMKLLTGDYARPLWVHDRAERWSVTFAKERPLIADFEGDRIGFTLRLAAVTRGSRELENAVLIAARFRPQSTRDGPAVVRDGEVSVEVSPDAPDAAELRAFLSRKFSAIFPPTIAFGGITPPVGGLIGRLRDLQLTEFRSTGGWLSVAYTLADTQK